MNKVLIGLWLQLCWVPLALSDNLVSQLDSVRQGLHADLSDFIELYCAIKNEPIKKDRVLSHYIFAFTDHDYNLVSSEKFVSGHSLVFESLSSLKRVIFHYHSNVRRIEYYHPQSVESWEEVTLSFKSGECEINSFTYKKAGQIEFESQAFEKKDLQAEMVDNHSKLENSAVVVAVIDSGLYLNQPELSPYILRNVEGEKIYRNDREFDNSPSSGENHGQHVAGIISRKSPRIAILPITRPSDNYLGSGPAKNILMALTESWIPNTALMDHATKLINQIQYNEIQFAHLYGARIVNMSFAAEYFHFSDLNTILAIENSLKGYEIAFKDFSDVIFVLAAGNNGQNIKQGQFHPSSERSFLAKRNVIKVASIGNDGKLSSFSNYGREVDFAAYGENILSLGGMMSFIHDEDEVKWISSMPKSGTSMAAPYVSNVIARLLHIKPSWKGNPHKIISFLCENVVKTNELRSKTRCGGYIDQEVILKAAMN